MLQNFWPIRYSRSWAWSSATSPISHPGYDIYGPGPRNLASRLNELMSAKLRFRSHAEVARFFEGLDLMEPGLVRVPEWRPDSDADRANPAAVWGGVARKS